jgi:hypothetical protein
MSIFSIPTPIPIPMSSAPIYLYSLHLRLCRRLYICLCSVRLRSLHLRSLYLRSLHLRPLSLRLSSLYLYAWYTTTPTTYILLPGPYYYPYRYYPYYPYSITLTTITLTTTTLTTTTLTTIILTTITLTTTTLPTYAIIPLTILSPLPLSPLLPLRSILPLPSISLHSESRYLRPMNTYAPMLSLSLCLIPEYMTLTRMIYFGSYIAILNPIDLYIRNPNWMPAECILSLSSPDHPIRYHPDHTYTRNIDILYTPTLSISIYLYSLDWDIGFSRLYIWFMNIYIINITDVWANIILSINDISFFRNPDRS